MVLLYILFALLNINTRLINIIHLIQQAFTIQGVKQRICPPWWIFSGRSESCERVAGLNWSQEKFQQIVRLLQDTNHLMSKFTWMISSRLQITNVTKHQKSVVFSSRCKADFLTLLLFFPLSHEKQRKPKPTSPFSLFSSISYFHETEWHLLCSHRLQTTELVISTQMCTAAAKIWDRVNPVPMPRSFQGMSSRWTLLPD